MVDLDEGERLLADVDKHAWDGSPLPWRFDAGNSDEYGRNGWGGHMWHSGGGSGVGGGYLRNNEARLIVWAVNSTPALIAELREARETIEAQREEIASLHGELDCLRTKDTCS